MLVQEVRTEMEPREVIRLAREFFTTRFTPYAAFVQEESEGHISLSTDAGEVVIGTGREGDRTVVRGSTSRLHHELSQFLATLDPAGDVRQNVLGPGVSGAG